MGVGKSGHIANKIASSLASTGTPAFYVHPTEANHGDLGMITSKDLVIIISNSGETTELLNTIHYCRESDIKIASITMNPNSMLAKKSDFVLTLPLQEESSKVSAPTTSTLMALSLGDSLVVALHSARGLTKAHFKKLHPGGKLGE
jgi:arabinose-5-phosphate isomerase